MHVSSVHLHYFKKFRDKTLKFCDPETGVPRDLVVLVGSNGSGKSSVLQAIAATIGSATRRIEAPSELDWPGFTASLVGNSWNLPSEVNVEVAFSSKETTATTEFFHLVPGLSARPDSQPPSQESNVHLTWKDGRVRAGNGAQYFQFRGREYAKQVVKQTNEGQDVFKRVGTIFWYTEQRTATSLTGETENGQKLAYTEDLLRRRLSDFQQFHLRVERNEYQLRPGQRDLFADLEQAYRIVFPNRRFEGPVPHNEIDQVLLDPWFFLYDGTRQYEISEMSGGERAIFPLLFDFANWNINNSIILIDEIELHLHPPMQQALVRALRLLGENNQFIISTHSDWVTQIAPQASIIHVEDSQ